MFSKKLLLGPDIEIPEFEYPILYEGDMLVGRFSAPSGYHGNKPPVGFISDERIAAITYNPPSVTDPCDIDPRMFKYTGPNGNKYISNIGAIDFGSGLVPSGSQTAYLECYNFLSEYSNYNSSNPSSPKTVQISIDTAYYIYLNVPFEYADLTTKVTTSSNGSGGYFYVYGSAGYTFYYCSDMFNYIYGKVGETIHIVAKDWIRT